MTADDFQRHGLLYYVNSTVLWPLGLSLTAEMKKDGGLKSRLSVISVEPAQNIVDNLADVESHPRHEAADFIRNRLLAMSPDESDYAIDALSDPDNVKSFLDASDGDV